MTPGLVFYTSIFLGDWQSPAPNTAILRRSHGTQGPFDVAAAQGRACRA